MDSNGFRTSGGWPATGVGTVPVPQFDSKQLTAPQLSKLLLLTWQLVNEYTGSSRIDAGLAQRITICYKPSVVIAMQKRRREEGRGGDIAGSCCVPQLSPTRQLRPAVRTRHHNPQTTGSNFASLST